jgi:membrane fusion protein (multidrug efflux system)
MFARVETLLPAEEQVLTLPREAIAFNTYGDSVFLLEKQDGKTIVNRRQVRTGEVRGTDVAVIDGLAAGDRVVVAGQVKLTNGQAVSVQGEAAAMEPNPGTGGETR